MADEETHEEAAADRMVPFSRLQKVGKARDAAIERAEAAEARLADLDKQSKAFERERKAWESTQAELESYKQREQDWGIERQIMGAGITDPEGIDFARVAWQRVAEDARPEGGIGAWLGGEPDSLPKAVRAYLPAKEQATTHQQQRHDPNRGAQQSTGRVINTGGVRPMKPNEWGQSRSAGWEGLGVQAPTLPSWHPRSRQND